MKNSSFKIKKFLFLLLVIAAGYVAANDETLSTSHVEKIVLGSGCFWGAEKGYESLQGVMSAVSGYSDGINVKPAYTEITKLKNKFNSDNHAEVVEITYNTNIISTKMLLKHYFESHDPTQLNRQGNDTGTQYRSLILYSNEAQKITAEEVLLEYQKLLLESDFGTSVTQVNPL